MRQQSTVNVNGLTLTFQADGPIGAPVVLLVHGHGGSAADWHVVMDDLKADHRVYAPTLRGHEGSDWPGEYSFELYGSDLDRFVETLGLSRVTLVGHSMGGIAAALLAQRRPAWLARLVLEEAPIPTPGWMTREVIPRPDEATNDWEHTEAVVRDFINEANPQWWDRLADIAVPTLAIGGGEDSGFPQHNVVGVADRIPDGRAATIAVGHLVHDAAPEEFLKVLRDFIDD